MFLNEETTRGGKASCITPLLRFWNDEAAVTILACWRSWDFCSVEGRKSSSCCLCHSAVIPVSPTDSSMWPWKKSLKTPSLSIPVPSKQEGGLNLTISQYCWYNIHSMLCGSPEKSPRLFIIFCYLLVMFLLLKFEFSLTWQSFLNNHHFSLQLLTSYCHHIENSC